MSVIIIYRTWHKSNLVFCSDHCLFSVFRLCVFFFCFSLCLFRILFFFSLSSTFLHTSNQLFVLFFFFFFYFSYDFKISSRLRSHYTRYILHCLLAFQTSKQHHSYNNNNVFLRFYASLIFILDSFFLFLFISLSRQSALIFDHVSCLLIHFGFFSFWKVHFVWLERWSYKRSTLKIQRNTVFRQREKISNKFHTFDVAIDTFSSIRLFALLPHSSTPLLRLLFTPSLNKYENGLR